MNILYTISLGTFCMSSNIFKLTNKKRFSCPFDWIVTDIDMIMDCIKDDFKKFTDKNNYEEIILNNKVFTHHKTYPIYIDSKKGKKLYTRFIHHNPVNNDNDYSYFIRCIDRFRNVLMSYKMKLFLCIEKRIPLDCSLDKYIELNNLINNKTTNYKFIVILSHFPADYKHDRNFFRKNVGKIRKKYEHCNLIVYSLFTRSMCKNGLNFSNDKDNENIINLIKSFDYNLEDI